MHVQADKRRVRGFLSILMGGEQERHRQIRRRDNCTNGRS